MSNRDINFKITVDGKEANATLSITEQQFRALAKAGDDVGKSTVSNFSNLGNIMTGINQSIDLFQKGLNVLSKPLEFAGQFESYETSLKVMLGSTELAKQRLQELTDFAASTPFELPDVINLGNQLQAIGQYSKQTMTDLGDLAAASGKPIEQVTGAFAKLATGQKGVAVDMFRDLLISTTDWEKAVGKSIDKITSEEMMGKLPEIMKSKGFAGMMEEQSKTFNGMMSNLADSFGGVMRDIGMMILPLAKDILGVIIPAISFLKDNIKEIGIVVLSAGVAFGTMQVVMNAGAIATALHTVAVNLFSGASIIATAKTWLFNTALMANPAGAIALAIGALVGGVILLSKAFGGSSSANKEANREMTETEKNLRTDQKEFQLLTAKLNDNSISLKERQRTLKEINEKYPGYLTNLNLEKASHEDIAKAVDLANKQFEKKIRLQVLEEQYRETIKKQVEIEQDLANNQISTTDNIIAGVKNALGDYSASGVIESVKRKTLDLAEIQKQAKDIQAEMNKLNSESTETTVKNTSVTKENNKTKEDRLKKEKEYLGILYSTRKAVSRDYEQTMKLNIPKDLMQEVQTSEVPKLIQESNFYLETQIALSDSVAQGWSEAGNALAGAMGAAVQVFGQANSLLQIFINSLVKAAAQALITKGVMALMNVASGGITGILGNIFGFAEGGIVTKPTLSMVGEGGEPEAVFPLSKLNNFFNNNTPNYSSQNINVSVSGEMVQSGMDMRAVLKLVDSHIKTKR